MIRSEIVSPIGQESFGSTSPNIPSTQSRKRTSAILQDSMRSFIFMMATMIRRSHWPRGTSHPAILAALFSVSLLSMCVCFSSLRELHPSPPQSAVCVVRVVPANCAAHLPRVFTSPCTCFLASSNARGHALVLTPNRLFTSDSFLSSRRSYPNRPLDNAI